MNSYIPSPEEGVRLWCGLTDSTWNTVIPDPGPYACISPVYGKKCVKKTSVHVIDSVKGVMIDSGAFSDPPRNRLSPSEALDRQLSHARYYDYEDKIYHIVSYDLLIDEKWSNGVRSKHRWEEEDAWYAVEETIYAAEYYSSNIEDYGIIFACQGVTAEQYSVCVESIIPMMDVNSDILGLGGWCILGIKKSKWLPEFWKTMTIVLPMLEDAEVKAVHIFGVMYAEALGGLLYLCDKHGLGLSTDSSGPSVRPALSRRWGYANWSRRCYFPPGKERGIARIEHIREVREWLKDLRKTIYYKDPLL